MNRPALHVLARDPGSSQVKTRLAQQLGRERATDLYRAFLVDLERLLRSCDRFAITIRVDRASAELDRLFAGRTRCEQGDGDLGERMGRAFAATATAPATLIIGSDAPLLELDRLVEAADRLAAADLVLDPASDGGYRLIGLRRGVAWAPLLTAMPWSTSTVLGTTLARAEAEGLTIACLPGGDDVDRPEDLEALSAALVREPWRAPATAACLAARPFEVP